MPEEGFALRASGIDVIYVNGYGFPGRQQHRVQVRTALQVSRAALSGCPAAFQAIPTFCWLIGLPGVSCRTRSKALSAYPTQNEIRAPI